MFGCKYFAHFLKYRFVFFLWAFDKEAARPLEMERHHEDKDASTLHMVTTVGSNVPLTSQWSVNIGTDKKDREEVHTTIEETGSTRTRCCGRGKKLGHIK